MTVATLRPQPPLLRLRPWPTVRSAACFRHTSERHEDAVWTSLRRLGVESAGLEDTAHDVLSRVMKRLGDFESAVSSAANRRGRSPLSSREDTRRPGEPKPARALAWPVAARALLAPRAMRSTLRFVLLAAVVGLGCVGEISSPRPELVAGEAGPTDEHQKPMPCARPAGDDAPLRVLSAREWENELDRVFAVDARDLSAASAGDPVPGTFDTTRENQDFTEGRFAALRALARAVTERLLAPQRRVATFGCDLGAQGRPCLERFVQSAAPLAFRRPVAATERDQLLALAAPEADPWVGGALVVRALLESPSFLFKVETGAGAPRLEAHEVASRLAFAATGRGPDAELLAAAIDGTVMSADVRRAHAGRLLQSEAGRRHLAAMVEEWFGTGSAERMQRSPSLGWTPEVAAAARTEALALLQRPLDVRGRFLDVFTEARHRLTPALGALYGVTVDAPGERDLSATGRGGIFGTAAFLAVSAGQRDQPSFVKRGVRLRDVVLCEAAPTPPAGAESRTTEMTGESPVEMADRHKLPECVGCHQLIDGQGRGFERYDAVGALRATYPTGQAVPAEGAFADVAGSRFTDAATFGAVMADNPRARRCVATRLFRWTRGRLESAADSCTIEGAWHDLEEGDFDLTGALLADVASERFVLAPEWETP